MDDNTLQDNCQDTKPGYYAVIPAQVRYDQDLPDKAKLLYGEISALSNAEGACYAGNEYFARLYGCTIGTVARQLGALEKAGYIVRELEKDESGQVVRRRIQLTVSTAEKLPLINFDKTPYQFCREGGIKNDKGINSININTKKEKEINKEKESRQAAFEPMPVFEDWIRRNFMNHPRERKNGLYLALERFVENRAALKKPMKSKAAVTALCNKLVKLTYGDTERMVELLDTAVVNGWQSVYGGKDVPAPTPVDEGEFVCL